MLREYSSKERKIEDILALKVSVVYLWGIVGPGNRRLGAFQIAFCRFSSDSPEFLHVALNSVGNVAPMLPIFFPNVY